MIQLHLRTLYSTSALSTRQGQIQIQDLKSCSKPHHGWQVTANVQFVGTKYSLPNLRSGFLQVTPQQPQYHQTTIHVILSIKHYQKQ